MKFVYFVYFIVVVAVYCVWFNNFNENFDTPMANTSPPMANTSPPMANTSPPMANTSPPMANTSPPMANIGTNIWRKSFDNSLQEFDKRYKYVSVLKYPNQYSVTGEFITDGIPGWNSTIE
jgi:hypothetical protein